MIDSNNIDVIRKNIKELSEQNDETLQQVGEIENFVYPKTETGTLENDDVTYAYTKTSVGGIIVLDGQVVPKVSKANGTSVLPFDSGATSPYAGFNTASLSSSNREPSATSRITSNQIEIAGSFTANRGFQMTFIYR